MQYLKTIAETCDIAVKVVLAVSAVFFVDKTPEELPAAEAAGRAPAECRWPR